MTDENVDADVDTSLGLGLDAEVAESHDAAAVTDTPRETDRRLRLIAFGVLPALISGLMQASAERPRLADDISPVRLALVERVAEHVARGGDEMAVSTLVTRLATAKVETASK